MTTLSWDYAAVLLAVAAVLFRLVDRPKTATVLSSLAILATTIAGWVTRRRRTTADEPDPAAE